MTMLWTGSSSPARLSAVVTPHPYTGLLVAGKWDALLGVSIVKLLFDR
jgi:hypothetical protein